MNKIWLTLLTVVVIGYYAFSRPHITAPGDPIDWSADPIQASTNTPPFEIETRKGKVTLDPRASFDASAVVTGDEHYRFDDGAFLVPVDLVMTWGKLPEEPFKSKVSYGQMTRYYFWHTKSAELDLHYITSHSANMHMIPADDNVRRALLTVGTGDRVRVHGLLVNAKRDDGFYWKTSLTREDDGPGACELVWVEEIQIGREVYR
ncbi:MAG TPA: hypothetical protein VGS07_24815 [Thermoanaerobaculia bacterium]|jgi:hypothetical protein|nr:hypothetical protein [Thermoanaerobaculia bacterium]